MIQKCSEQRETKIKQGSTRPGKRHIGSDGSIWHPYTVCDKLVQIISPTGNNAVTSHKQLSAAKVKRNKDGGTRNSSINVNGRKLYWTTKKKSIMIAVITWRR